MIKRKYMRTRQLKPGMKLNHPVVDRLGRNLVARGAELDDYMIDSLLKLGIMSVYIQEGEEEENPEQVPTSPEAEKNIERLRTEDRAKLLFLPVSVNVSLPVSSLSTTIQPPRKWLPPQRALPMT
jgi:hypothetical protein